MSTLNVTKKLNISAVLSREEEFELRSEIPFDKTERYLIQRFPFGMAWLPGNWQLMNAS